MVLKRLIDIKSGICPLQGYDNKEPFAKTFMALKKEHPYIRFSKAHCASWSESKPVIGKSERIVGIPRPHRVVSPMIFGLFFDHELCRIIRQNGTPAQQKLMDKLLDYFPGKHITQDIIRDEAIRRGAPWHYSIGNGASFQGHMVIDYAKILRIGIPGLRDEILEAMKQNKDPDKEPFYQALMLYCENMADLCKRYAEKAQKMSLLKSSAHRKDQLAEITSICTALTIRPPVNFKEALQLYWFTFLLDNTDDPGRLDHLLYDFYSKDYRRGYITREYAKDLLTELWYKMQQVSAWSLVLGGQTFDGEDASNELTYICLEITADLHVTNPSVALRVSEETPRHLWRAAMNCIAKGGGMPSLVNDDAVVRAMVESGIPVEDARDYAMGGCIEFQVSGKSNFGGEDGQINLVKCLELALNNGRCALTGELMGLETGDPYTFTSYDQLLDAYKRQVEHAITDIVTQCNIGMEIKSRQGAKVFRSLLIDDCIKRGLDCEGGGARYGNGQILTNGIIVTADSLSAMNHLVYEKEMIKLSDLLDALRNNWQGYESLRQTIIYNAPRYGNDDPRADDTAREVASHLWSFLKGCKTYRGGHFTGLIVYFNRQLYFGRQTAATPDGRFSGDVIEDSVGPWPGRDVHGPTAMMQSASRIPQELAAGGVVMNLKLVPNCFGSEDSIEKTIDLIRGYFAIGGQQVQITVASADDMKAALLEPEKWRHLIVRVGGYCDYFVNLDPTLQESILMRSQHQS
ncbi:MAG: pyruvate formate lyase family protein [Armatimonadota bacterium]